MTALQPSYNAETCECLLVPQVLAQGKGDDPDRQALSSHGQNQVQCWEGGGWGEFQKDAIFKLQGVEEHLQEWEQHAETQREKP